MARYVSYEKFVYECDRDFTEYEKTLCDVLRSRRDFKSIQLENDQSYSLRFEKMDNHLLGFFRTREKEKMIRLNVELLSCSLQEIQSVFFHELTHLLLEKSSGHTEAFFILLCVIYQRYYFLDLDFIDHLDLYDLQDIEVLSNIVFNRFDTCETLLNLTQVKEIIKLFNKEKLSLREIIEILEEEDLAPFFHIKQ